jgi:hypothetical protein
MQPLTSQPKATLSSLLNVYTSTMATKTTELCRDRMELPFRGVENDTSAYLPLDPAFKHIRCIALLNGSFDDTITCELVYTSLHEHVVW